MKSATESIRAGHLRPALSAGLACVLLVASACAQAGKVTPPPLPPGSALVKVQPGMDKQEQMREDRAHHNKNVKKDPTKDDSVSGNNGNGNGKGNK
ncbi:hypothetical protein ACFPOE_00320 [Caenimonas terrae]|uniref:Lipoprotein n=1 Tax=Caenimonas terrae TaxID=696074 RepID=A0ABW0N5M3_9BURK